VIAEEMQKELEGVLQKLYGDTENVINLAHALLIHMLEGKITAQEVLTAIPKLERECSLLH
jgi:hypothetical protein